MRSDRNLKVLAVIAITLAVGALSVGFAAFSRTLNISNVTATVQSASWDISFTNLDTVATTGTATANNPTFTSGATSISDIAIGLTTPGDSVTYTFDVENAGDFDATAQTITLGTPVCAVAGDTTHVDAVNVCSNLTYSLTYADDSEISAEASLNSGVVKTLKLTLVYNADTTADELPENTVNITGLDSSIIYVQN